MKKFKLGKLRICITRFSEKEESDIIRNKTISFIDDLNATIDNKVFNRVDLVYKTVDSVKSGHDKGKIVINRYFKDFYK